MEKDDLVYIGTKKGDKGFMKITTSKKAIIFSLIIVALAAAFVLSGHYMIIHAEAEQLNTSELKIFSNATINDNFDDKSVIVVLTEEAGGMNKTIDYSLFNSIAYSSIKDLTKIDNISSNYLDSSNFNQILKITLTTESKQNVLNVIKELEDKEEFLWTGPNYSGTIESEQNTVDTDIEDEETLYDKQWGLHGEYGINAEEAWNIGTGSTSVRVGVMDTGIAAHDNLPTVAEGWDFINDVAITSGDLHGHGTHVAGIIAATGNAVSGVDGVCDNIRLVPMVVAEPVLGRIETEDVIEAVTWAINNDIDIINFSGGGMDDNVAMIEALNNFTGLLVCCAGNYESDNDVNPYYPASYSTGQTFSERVISVGAIDSNGDIPDFSNYGANSVSIFAPGVDVLSTYPAEQCTGETVESIIDGTILKCEAKLSILGWVRSFQHEENGYHYCSGTSMSTPFVTGTAALLYAKYLTYSNGMERAEIAAEIKDIILDTSTYDARYEGKCVSSGRLNAYEALRYSPARRVMEDFGFTEFWYNWHGTLNMFSSNHDAFTLDDEDNMTFTQSTTLYFSVGTDSVYNAWKEILSTITFELKNSAGTTIALGDTALHTCNVRVGLVSNISYTNRTFSINLSSLANDTYTLSLESTSIRDDETYNHSKEFSFTVNIPDSCVTEGTMITLADGSQKAVEDLTGDEMLLVWNMFTGEFDSAPILFIDSEPAAEFEVIKLTFSDGTVVDVIDEHAFWNFDLNEYVFIREDAAKYIGDTFNRQTYNENGEMSYSAVQLTDVDIVTEYTTAWSPVTYGHLCYYVNGMLSMPGATEGLINIFEVDPDTMTIDSVQYAADIAEYGLYTYDEFVEEVFELPLVMFEAFNGQYMKVAIGKGLITVERLTELFARYGELF